MSFVLQQLEKQNYMLPSEGLFEIFCAQKNNHHQTIYTTVPYTKAYNKHQPSPLPTHTHTHTHTHTQNSAFDGDVIVLYVFAGFN